MTRTKTLAAIGTALAIASTAALAQPAGPDFSPMMPDTDQRDAQPSQTDPANRADNRMLDAYQSSNTLRDEPAAPPVEVQPFNDTYVDEAHAPRITQPTPRQSTIGNGLFDRRGPNDFGA